MGVEQVKMHWVHRHYWKMGPEGNDIQKTNVPNLRMRFRAETFYDELSTVSCTPPAASPGCVLHCHRPAAALHADTIGPYHPSH